MSDPQGPVTAPSSVGPETESPAILNLGAASTAAPKAAVAPKAAASGGGIASKYCITESDAKKIEKEELETPYLKEVKDVFHYLVVTEKNLGLYPLHSKVVRNSMDKFYDTLVACMEKVGSLRIGLSAECFVFQDEEIYREDEKSKSLSFRIHKDGVRELSILQDVSREECEAFLTCLKHARRVDDEDDDFITLFWEKDCTNIQLQLADDYVNNDDLPPVPEHRSLVNASSVSKFKIPKSEKDRLNEALDRRQSEDDGESTFEISEEEAAEIREMVANEGAYFPLFDFVDILLELMARNPDSGNFDRSVSMLRTIIAAVIEDLDFKRAANLMKKLSEQSHPGLTEKHMRQLREMLESLTDKNTLVIIDKYLAESAKLPPGHPVFEFMKAYPRSSAESFCPMLSYSQHVQGVSKVLVHLGTGSVDALAKHLDDPDPLIVRAMIGVLLDTDEEASVKHIAKALRHDDEKVRLHAAQTILEKGTDGVASLLIPLLGESSKQLLNLALKFFAKHTCPDAYENLETLVRSRNFNLLDQKGKRLCFKALLKSSYVLAIEFLRGSVFRWSLTFTQHQVEKRSAALVALAETSAKQSREIIERFAKMKRSKIKRVAIRCLKEFDRDRDQGSGAQKGSRGTKKPRSLPPQSMPAENKNMETSNEQRAGGES